jgi:Flp pilus assembly protein CpaB
MGLSRLARSLNGWPRRLLAVGCLLLAGFSALPAHRSGARANDSTVDTVVAAHDLAAGSAIGADDVRIAHWPSLLRPATALTKTTDLAGRTLAGPVGAGEVITSSRLVGTELTAGLPAGMIAVPVPLVDPGAASLIRAGNHVDLLIPDAAPSPTATAHMIATDVLVLAVLPRNASSAAANAQLVVAVDHPTELRIAQAITTPMLATVIKPP